jgi:hypothetical protein
MLSERLAAAGYHSYAIDLRKDKVDDPSTNDPVTGNPGKNMDHGWATPIAQHFLERIFAANPGRDVSIVAFDLGVTVARDALRRLYSAGDRPFDRLRDVILAAGCNHGVSTYLNLCGDPSQPRNITMRGRGACELGDRYHYTPTAFLAPLNGAASSYETPCADGVTAFGQTGACGARAVRYTTIVMEDSPNGALQEEVSSEKSAALRYANRLTVSLSDTDLTGYFYNGLLKNHFGALRSETALKYITGQLAR